MRKGILLNCKNIVDGGYLLLCVCMALMTMTVTAQHKKIYFPGWTFHQQNAAIIGISGGLFAVPGDEPRRTNTFGLRIELPGVGIVAALVPASPLAETDSAVRAMKLLPLSEKIYGVNLSLLGTICHCTTNGVSLSGIGQMQYVLNGISFSPVSFAQHHNGLQLGIYNYTYKMNGIQIGFINNSRRTRGLQIGLWNKNEKRSLPIINWNFRG